MRKYSTILLVLFSFLLVVNAKAQLLSGEYPNKGLVLSNLSSMPLAFTENGGQFGDKTLFKANAGGATFYFCNNEMAYLFVRDTDELEDSPLTRRQEPFPDAPSVDRPRYKKESMLIKAQFIGANPNPEVIGEGRLPHNNNYFYGNDPSKWRTDVPNYSSILYKDIYSGIDLKYYGDGRSIKYDFIVNPGADVSQIRIRYDGVDDLSVTPNGDLQARTAFGLVYEKVPYIYQEIGGAKREVAGRYEIVEPGIFGFEVDDYNPSLTLVIDPELVYSTYLGGSGYDEGFCIAVDADGNAYVTGSTVSSDFPTVNPYDGSRDGWDVFVTKFSAVGNSLVYSTYLGGDDGDYGQSIAVDAGRYAYVTGRTHSTDFPTLNPYQTDQDDIDVFVTKFSPEGNSLVYSTYLGGDSGDNGRGIAVDGSGNAYVTGRTLSSDFPTVNPYDGSFNGDSDVFVTKFSAVGNSLVYSTYLGGSSDELGMGIAVDGSGSAYVTGETSSTDFPTENPYQTDQGSSDAFVTKLSSGGNSLVYSTYLGGNLPESGYSIAVDGPRNAYVTGFTASSDFPTVNPYDGSFNGEEDVFVTKFSAVGNSLVYSTYLGGSGDDWGRGIAVDGSGNAYVTGFTASSDFPTVNPYDGSFNGEEDVFVTKFSAAGNSLVYSTYLGGSIWDGGWDIAVDGSRNAYVTGGTYSSDFPTVNPYDGSFNGMEDVFVAKFGPSTEEIPTLSEWGMIILALLLLTTGTVAVIRKRRAAIAGGN